MWPFCQSVVTEVDMSGSISTPNNIETGVGDESSSGKGQEEVLDMSGLESSDDEAPSKPKRPRSPKGTSRDRGQDKE